MASTDLIVAGDDSPVAVLRMEEGELNELIRENLMPGENLSVRDLVRVRVPTGGAQMWTVNTLRGEEAVKSIEGVLLRVDLQRAYWPDEYTGGNDEPQCRSDDGIQGVGDPGVSCEVCPFNEFGTALKGSGKACKEMRQLFLLPLDGILPYVVTIPPASLANFKAYRLKLLGSMLKQTDVVTCLELEKAENDTGVKYSRVVPTAGQFLDPTAVRRIRAFAAMLAPSMDRAAKDIKRSDTEENA